MFWSRKRRSPQVLEQWDFYLKFSDGVPRCSIALNMALAQLSIPVNGLDWVLRVQLGLGVPNPHNSDGWSKEERQELCAAEDILAAEVAARLGGIFAGHIISMDCRIFENIYYVPSNSRFDDAVNAVRLRCPGCSITATSQEDTDWSVYFEELYPDNAERHQMLNRQVIQNLQEHGDELTAAREVRHWVYFGNAYNRSQFIEQVCKSGFQILESELPNDGTSERRFCAQIYREDHVDPRSIDPLVIELAELADRFEGEYDGWETQVIASGPSDGDTNHTN